MPDKQGLQREAINAAKALEKARQRIRGQGRSASQTDLRAVQDAEKKYDKAKKALDSI
jgi:hypothetical protein